MTEKINEKFEVKVNDGMTLCYPQDKQPYVVTRVSESGKTAWVAPLMILDGRAGREPDDFDGPFPVWNHKYTEKEILTLKESDIPETRIHFNKKRGWINKGGMPFSKGAVYYRNYSY